ncbi:MAG TPA: OsmC family protein [Membranihabitans sp.]|nr:OsmC family protein [Membranihabitans sp.]
MEYFVKAGSISKDHASIDIKHAEIQFGITPDSDDALPNPAELFLGSFTACILKNVERFSHFLKFEYSRADIVVKATRLEHPPRMDKVHYELMIFSNDQELNVDLLKKNIEKFGTIFNTVKTSCTITGNIVQMTD